MGAFLNDGVNYVAAHALDGVQAEADKAAIRRKAAAGDINIRLLDLDAQTLALGRIFNNF